MKIWTAFIMVLLLSFFVGISSAYAEIKIKLPKPISAERFAEIFIEEFQKTPEIVALVTIDENYTPGSVKMIPSLIMIDIYRNSPCFLFFRCGRGPDLTIKLRPGELYSEVVMLDYTFARNPNHHRARTASTSNSQFQKMKPDFDKVLLRVYARIRAEK